MNQNELQKRVDEEYAKTVPKGVRVRVNLRDRRYAITVRVTISEDDKVVEVAESTVRPLGLMLDDGYVQSLINGQVEKAVAFIRKEVEKDFTG